MAISADPKKLRRENPLHFKKLGRDFPGLKKPEKALTSPPTASYNCIAWAVDVVNAWWWPNVRGPGDFWPPEAPNNASLESFHFAYGTMGYEPISEGDCENYERVIALMGKDGKVTHAMKRLSNGSWSSKLGNSFDIVHELHELDSPTYGEIIGFMGRGKKK